MIPARGFLGAVICAFLILSFSALATKVMYVTDRMQVVIRIAPTQESKIISHISTGEVVTFIESIDDGWVKVRTNDGKEGWALTRYFMEEPPAAMRLKDIDPQHKNLVQKLEDMRKEIQDAKSNLMQFEIRAQQAESAYQKLRSDSLNIIRLRDDYQKLNQEFQQQGEKLERLIIENESLHFTNSLKWFLAGSGTLLLGWIIGAIYGRRKRRWSSSLDLDVF